MTDKKDGPGQKDGSAKAGERAGSDSAAKRPFATIDLKAVEVPADARKSGGPVPPKAAEPPNPRAPSPAMPKGQAEAAAKVAAASASQGAAAKPAGSPSASAAPGASPRPADAASAGAGKTSATSATSAAGSAVKSANAPPPSAAAGARRAGGGFGSHLLSGLIGGAVALLLGPLFAPQVDRMWEEIGVSASPPPASPQVAQRLAALEKKAAEPAAAPAPESDPVRANAAAAENSKRIDALQAQLTAVGEMQTSVSSLTSDLAARLSRQPPIADVGERLVALEQQLSELGAAARSEPDRAGRIPQLAQMTGRIADLETALTTRVGEVRKDATREIETRLAPVTEASEAARSATQRIDREIGTLKSETNRLATGLEKAQTDTQRLQLALKAAGDETAKLGGALDTTRRDLETRIQSLAKPADLTAAVAPLSSRIGALEQSLTTVVKSEGERNATAERIVLSLELGNLKRAMERGLPYNRELGEVAKVSGSRIDLRPLEPYRNTGVPTLAQLTGLFQPVAHAILDADTEKSDGSVVDRLLSGAKTFVRVRKTTHATGDTTAEAVIARVEDSLKAGRLGDVLTEFKALERKPEIAKEWIAKVEARQTVEAALKSIDEALKASLGAGPAPEAQKKGQP